MTKNILLVDDSSVMRKIVARAIRQTGLEVDIVAEAANGKEALTALESNSVDLVFCDWNMPEMNGIEFIAAARQSYQMPIVMLTTEGTNDRMQEALTAGANAYVTKPFTPETLQEKMKALLDI